MNKIIILFVLVILVLGGYFLIKNNAKYSTNQSVIPSPTIIQPTQTPINQPSTNSAQTVTLTSSGFTPLSLTIKKGTKVVWTNKSGGVATVDSELHPTHLLYLPLNLGKFNDGETLNVTFAKEGTYTYHDHLHPTMKGTIVVE